MHGSAASSRPRVKSVNQHSITSPHHPFTCPQMGLPCRSRGRDSELSGARTGPPDGGPEKAACLQACLLGGGGCEGGTCCHSSQEALPRQGSSDHTQEPRKML